MLIASDKKYIPSLKSLWHNVFGDEEGYIDLFFKKQYYSSKTFASFDGEEAVSALYLLPCKIRFEKKLYDGFYLYAAATDVNHRKKGIMKELIEEAFGFARDEKIDFISLVPANDHLYNYYSKLGFETAMYKSSKVAACFENDKICATRASAEEYLALRSGKTENSFLWESNEFEYVLDCFLYYGIIPYMTDDCAFILNKDERKICEFIGSDSAFESAASFVSEQCRKNEITADGPGFEKRVPFGMIYPINNDLKRKWSMDDIYMNLALD